MKTRSLIFIGLAMLAGAALGEMSWGISLERPAFLWLEGGRFEFLSLGALLGLAWALLQAAFWRLTFRFRFSGGFRLGATSLFPILAGYFWPLARHLHLPPPHDFFLRSLQVFAAALVLATLGLALALGLIGVLRGRLRGRVSSASVALRLGALAWIVTMLAGIWTFQWTNTGDAPHYLLMTHSLAYDHDTDLANNYDKRDWLAFYDRVLEKQSGSQVGASHYPLHRPGLPLLMAPAYRFLGASGALWTLGFLAALGGALVFLWFLKLGFSQPWAMVGWALFSFSAPWLMNSQAVMGELLSGLLLIMVLCAWSGVLPAWLSLAAAGYLFWVNVRFYPLAFVILVLDFWNLPGLTGRFKGLIAFFLMFVGALALNHLEFGSYNPLAVFQQNKLGAEHLFRFQDAFKAAFGIFLDQEYGWFVYAPAFLLLCEGVFIRPSALTSKAGWSMLILSVVYLAPVTLVQFWHGDMAPARYLVFLTPIFALFTLLTLRRFGRHLWVWAFPVAGAFMSYAMLVFPWLCFSKKMGENVVLKALSRVSGINLTPLFPSFIIGNLAALIYSLLFTAGLLFLFLRRREPRPS